METKKMTLQEAQEFVNNTKFICTSVEDTKRVQKKLFELGIRWEGEQAYDVNEDAFLLLVEDYELLLFGDITYWVEDTGRRIEPSEILAIEIKQEPKPKFDPKTLQVFDKVLVRDSEMQAWRAKFFHCRKGGQFYTIDDTIYQICIPYNDDTKHLHGTRDDAHEFYNIW